MCFSILLKYLPYFFLDAYFTTLLCTFSGSFHYLIATYLKILVWMGERNTCWCSEPNILWFKKCNILTLFWCLRLPRPWRRSWRHLEFHMRYTYILAAAMHSWTGLQKESRGGRAWDSLMKMKLQFSLPGLASNHGWHITCLAR